MSPILGTGIIPHGARPATDYSGSFSAPLRSMWCCDYCKSLHVAATVKQCPNCGAPREA